VVALFDCVATLRLCPHVIVCPVGRTLMMSPPCVIKRAALLLVYVVVAAGVLCVCLCLSRWLSESSRTFSVSPMDR